MKRRERLLASTLGLFCTVAQLPAAHAEDASATETAAARSLAVEGLKLAQANNCADAVPKLERAEKLYHSSVVAIRLGECLVSVGRLVEGTEILRKALREPQPADPAPTLTKALERAQKVLDDAKPRIGGLTIKLSVVPDMTLKIDGNAVASTLVDTEIPTDPGEHHVNVAAPGYLKSGTKVTLGEGEKKSVSLSLARDPNAAVAPVATATPAAKNDDRVGPVSTESEQVGAASTSAPHDRAPNHTAAYVSFGFGAAGLATGGVLGFLTMQKHKDLQSKCPADECPAGRQADLDSAKRLGTFSTIAFAVGGAGVALGAVLYFTGGSSSNADHARQHGPRFAGISRPRLALLPGAVQLGADF